MERRSAARALGPGMRGPSSVGSIGTLADMERLAAAFAPLILGLHRIYLRGEIGAGKTTFVGAVLRALGHVGAVKSPTFTFAEPYVVAGRSFYHIDLYRLESPGDVEFLGLSDYLEEGVALVEWPERAPGFMPLPDIDLLIRSTDDVREITCTGYNEQGQRALNTLAQRWPGWHIAAS